ncbi:ALG6, ALG8 glycosyltransferase family-domain-containing protein [Aspergillus pseudonomiae]|uniref:Alpha-1,3-glucosyltransferase n=1 Tax=Aspergillus pseudonomiae TaxID=1506151 RepID=A0A5N6HV96_9EURO|nr:ALG6, ALG8 glycosyltransferase family-domain-containing protein [Aspergillus pseudonomiae]KAB8258346.1 ALG6, ALG8 glycosyltransferase family-domain-containing protein [Aspergillus pseudonomiae]KAE8407888.1 ALG6, ALG8 glycosyltransferase family-domain-containing protein [Aspergillus pseudonomiae]
MAPPSSYRPRKKRKFPLSSTGSNNALIVDDGNGKHTPAFPLVSFLWAARAGVSQWLILPLILMAVGLFRWAVSLWGYSGFQVPPMHGDFEAQRHWMEITINLPMSKWYTYDLQYWGLDYPPLTAYHSWLLGKIGTLFDPSWFALDKSRGFEDPRLKVYMRATVVVSEYLIFIPAVVNFLRRYTQMHGVPVWSASVAMVAILLQPSTILIDHGHFQYNTVMLGLVAASLDAILAGRMLWACIFFVGALGFKQMALYYAPVMFAFLLGICVFPRIQLIRLLCISLVTIVAFAVLIAPLVVSAISADAQIELSSIPLPPLLQALPIELDKGSILYAPLLQLTQVIHRVFPFARGLFEDKVANAWCAIHTFYKLHRFEATLLQRVSLGATLASILIPCAIIFRHPRASFLLPALSTVAWGFFLFSFQVHEKSVLLPLLPMTLMLSGDGGLSKETRAWVGWANMLGSWTMFPLLQRDGLRVPYFVMTFLWAYLLGLPPASLEVYRGRSSSDDSSPLPEPHIITKLLHLCFYLAMVAWHVLEAFVPPPPAKPDLWVVLNVLIGAGGFGLAYLWCLRKLILQCWMIGRKVEKDSQKKNQ